MTETPAAPLSPPGNDDLAELLGHMTSRWDDERRQLARQLHDSLGSSMTALSMHLGLLAKKLPDDQALQDRSAQMKQLLMNIINTNRDMQLALWNDKLEFLGIKAALDEAVSEFGKAHPGLAAQVSLPDDEAAYSREQNVTLLRCAEEGMQNVARHAHASRVDVILDDDGEQIMLTIIDDGVGPGDADLGMLDHHGLRMLQARARHLGGAVAFGPAPEGGAMLRMTLPLAAPKQAA
ncbi:sensor histidine kinase [Massilia sp. S19_KUP03_FR1]|uniref:sensor histidine kinase n=1 Tax=Massilia sp. S19_KUP03_FR1 TaxID=3025503 RepID=UPI002FCDBD05